MSASQSRSFGSGMRLQVSESQRIRAERSIVNSAWAPRDVLRGGPLVQLRLAQCRSSLLPRPWPRVVADARAAFGGAFLSVVFLFASGLRTVRAAVFSPAARPAPSPWSPGSDRGCPAGVPSGRRRWWPVALLPPRRSPGPRLSPAPARLLASEMSRTRHTLLIRPGSCVATMTRTWSSRDASGTSRGVRSR